MKRNILILLLSFVTMFVTAQEVVVKNTNKRVGINMRISSKGEILNISISVVKEFANRITKEQFLQFANRIKSTIVTSDYMELKHSSVEQYCTYFWAYENK